MMMMLVHLCFTFLVSLSLGSPVTQQYLYTPNFTPVFFFPPLVYSDVSEGDAIAEVVEPDETINSRTCSEEGGLFQNPVNPKDWYICVAQEDGSLKVLDLSKNELHNLFQAHNWQTQWWANYPDMYPGPQRLYFGLPKLGLY